MSAANYVNPRTRTSAQLAVQGAGDELAAASLRGSAERLLACGIDELTIDLSCIDDGDPAFLRTLAVLTATARDHSCELFVTGVHSPALLAALDDAPLDELFAIYGAACRHDANPTTTATTRPGPRDRSLMPEPPREQFPAPAQHPVTSAPLGSAADVTGTPRHARAETTPEP